MNETISMAVTEEKCAYSQSIEKEIGVAGKLKR